MDYLNSGPWLVDLKRLYCILYDIHRRAGSIGFRFYTHHNCMFQIRFILALLICMDGANPCYYRECRGATHHPHLLMERRSGWSPDVRSRFTPKSTSFFYVALCSTIVPLSGRYYIYIFIYGTIYNYVHIYVDGEGNL